MSIYIYVLSFTRKHLIVFTTLCISPGSIDTHMVAQHMASFPFLNALKMLLYTEQHNAHIESLITTK